MSDYKVYDHNECFMALTSTSVFPQFTYSNDGLKRFHDAETMPVIGLHSGPIEKNSPSTLSTISVDYIESMAKLLWENLNIATPNKKNTTKDIPKLRKLEPILGRSASNIATNCFTVDVKGNVIGKKTENTSKLILSAKENYQKCSLVHHNATNGQKNTNSKIIRCSYCSGPHYAKDVTGKTTCPILRAYCCPICKCKGGDQGHSIRYSLIILKIIY